MNVSSVITSLFHSSSLLLSASKAQNRKSERAAEKKMFKWISWPHKLRFLITSAKPKKNYFHWIGFFYSSPPRCPSSFSPNYSDSLSLAFHFPISLSSPVPVYCGFIKISISIKIQIIIFLDRLQHSLTCPPPPLTIDRNWMSSQSHSWHSLDMEIYCLLMLWNCGIFRKISSSRAWKID